MSSISTAMARIAAIEATLGSRTSPPPRESSPAVIKQTFDQVMARAVAGMGGPGGGTSYRTLGDYAGFGGTGTLWGTGATPYGGYGSGAISSGAPPGLEGFQNGRIPLSALSAIPGTDEAMWAPAAGAFVRMREAARADGIELVVVDGYRPYEDQVRLAAELGLYSEGGWAAHPGTSQHGWGRAVDVETDDETVAWLRANAGRFGFVETVPREPWHWEYHP